MTTLNTKFTCSEYREVPLAYISRSTFIEFSEQILFEPK